MTSIHDDRGDVEIDIVPAPKRNRLNQNETDKNETDRTGPGCQQIMNEDEFEEMANPSTEIITFTDEHKKALDLFEQNQNLLITGPAGTGKTTLLKEIIKRCENRTILQTGPTGVSALQLPNGKTLHSAVKIPVGVYPPQKDIESYYLRLWQKLFKLPSYTGANEWFKHVRDCDVWIIDEVSMVSVYMMSILDTAFGILRECRHKPFGGVQVIFVGDFMQHPPVYDRRDKSVHPDQGKMAFKSPVWSALNVQVILLTRIFRQQNEEFANLLNLIRSGEKLSYHYETLFKQLMNRKHTLPGDQIFICHKRADVAHMNKVQMEKLLSNQSDNVYIDFPYHVLSKYKEDEEDMVKNLRENLNLGKHEASQVLLDNMRVMLIRNSILYDYDSSVEIKLVNGDTGIVVGFAFPPKPIETAFPSKIDSILNTMHVRYSGKPFKKTRFPIVKFDRFPDFKFQILPSTWKRQEINPSDGEMVIRIEVDAVPLIPSWAITSHRCQGATISNIPITINADCMEFCEGSFYVAFSRGREFEQISIINYKGHRQNKDAYGFYKGFLILECPREYKMMSNEEDLIMRFGEKKKKKSEQDKKPNLLSTITTKESDFNMTSHTSSNHTSSMTVGDPMKPTESPIPTEPPIPTESQIPNVYSVWENSILPHANTISTDLQQFDIACKLMKQWMKTTRKKLKK